MPKRLYLANPYGFSAQQRSGALAALVEALEAAGAEVWEPFARNNPVDKTAPGWAYRIGQADLRDVRTADGAVRGGQRLPAGRRGDGGARPGDRLGQADVLVP